MTFDRSLPESETRDGVRAGKGQRPAFDPTVANHARVYNYLLGGKDHFAADRAAGEATIKAYPTAAYAARANRAFLARVVRYLAAEAGIRQFLDIGTGMPTANNTHEVAQSVAPESRIVYVDNDPVVLAHARALLTSSPEGKTDYIDADLCDPEKILTGAAAILDFSQPVAVLLIAMLHVIADDAAYPSVARLVDAVPSSSYLALSQVASDIHPEKVADAMGRIKQAAGNRQAFPRSHAEVARFFGGLDLVEPGLVQVPQWRPDIEPAYAIALWCGVGQKP